MKRSVLLCLALFIMDFLLAQQPVLLRSAQFLDFEGSKVDLPGGATIVFWNDQSTENNSLRCQMVTNPGSQLLEPECRNIYGVLNGEQHEIRLAERTERTAGRGKAAGLKKPGRVIFFLV